MKAPLTWSYRPYSPLLYEVGNLYICRVAPGKNNVFFAWLDTGEKEYTVRYRKFGEESYISIKTSKTRINIIGLQEAADYEFYVEAGEKQSRVRFARTGEVPGTVVNYLHPLDRAYAFSGNFLCSPSLVRHPDGFLLASMDVYAPRAPQNLTIIFRSDDEGETWNYVSELFPCFWMRMFIHRGSLYAMGVSTEYGDLLLGRSDDGGKTFCTPSVLFRGSCHSGWPGIHRNPVNLVEYKGRLWTAVEWGCWAQGGHAPMMASVPVDADLLDAANWAFTPPLPYHSDWPGTANGDSAGCIEGTTVIAPDGELYNIMRYEIKHCEPDYGLVLAYKVDTENPENPLIYDRAIKLNGNHSKFEIQYDEKSGWYLSIISRITDSTNKGYRNLLSLMKSRDLDNWELVCDLLDYTQEDPKKVGFQYIAYLLEENDLLYLNRAALNDADSYHNANYSLFHRVKDFRSLL